LRRNDLRKLCLKSLHFENGWMGSVMRLEQIRDGVRVHGLDSDGVADILAAKWIGADALDIAYRVGGQTRSRMLLRADEETLRPVSEDSRLFALDGDGGTFRLAAEATRIRLAHLFDPYLAVHASRIEALPHQITAVYGEMLSKQPLRFLLADDPGAGKTIMAGLLIKELVLRGDLERCLIVAPGSLVEQWQDELSEKFELDFDILSRDQIESSRTGNPFEERDRLIVRLDMAARSDELVAKLEAARSYDLVICDEAHRMSATVFGGETKYTKRYQFGQRLGACTRNLLLMTATPHNGKDADFQLFMGLLDSDRFEGRFREGVHKVDVGDMMRRLTKEELRRFDGTPLFPERRAYTVRYALSSQEQDLYDAVTRYVREEMNRAEQTLADDKRRQNVGFALQILQRRLASSPAAIHESLKRRLARLEAWLAEERMAGAAAAAKLKRPPVEPRLLSDPEDFEEAPEAEIEAAEEAIVDQATAAQTLAELEAEIAILRDLEGRAAKLRASNLDAKWSQLDSILDDPLVVDPASGGRRKLIIFTEPRDTLEYLALKIRKRIGREDSVAVIHGGVTRERRRAAIAAFNDDPTVRILIANDAAGEGVNLQRGAHLMVNYDLPWNPNRLEQRFGRIHRIGQTEVCHLWNLVAADTREGEVYARLLDKLEAARAALGGQVFDVLGELFDGNALRDLLMQAVRYGERADVRARLFESVDGSVDRDRIEALVRERKLTREGMDPSQVAAIRAEMERAEARRLQPRYVKAFFEEAFSRLGGDLRGREIGRFEVTRTPAILREHDRLVGRTDPVLERYARICFDKTYIPGDVKAALVAPGHPLLDGVVNLTLERHRGELKRGAILVDESDEGDTPRLLIMLDHTVRDGRKGKDGQLLTLSRRLQFVLLDAKGGALGGGAAPYLDCRPASDEERACVAPLLNEPWLKSEIESRALAFAVQHLAPRHLDEVRARRLPEIDKVRSEVEARLIQEINYWDARAEELALQEAAGKSQRLNADNARRIAERLAERLNIRRAELEREKQIIAETPQIAGAALVIPIGLFRAPPTAAPASGVMERNPDSERIAMDAVMDAERAAGRLPTDVSAQKVGYDIESLDPATGALLFIEVKGRAPDGDVVAFTRNEMLTAWNKPDAYRVALILIENGFAREPLIIHKPHEVFGPEPGFAETARFIRTADLVDRARNRQ
jgi:superfamily II DNA or RNA helicase